MKYVYRGLLTKLLYSYAAPVAFTPTGTAAPTATISGETAVLGSIDGSIQRGTIGASPPGDPYSPGVAPSLWESS